MAKTEIDPNNNSEISDSKLQNGKKDEYSFVDAFANIKMEDLYRGGTLENIEQRCLDLCQTYIGGTWSQAKSIDDIEVKRISGGLTNQLYKVALKDSIQSVPDGIYRDEPRVVAIKIYQPKHMINYNDEEAERLNDIIILTILSEVNIGPKVYGIFNDGVIQAYLEHEQFRPKHQKTPKLLRELANQIAKTNYLNVPLRKNNNWVVNEMRTSLDKGFSNPEVIEALKELNLEYLGKRDLSVELEEFDGYIKQLNPPRVFCHNDFRGSNILVDCHDQSIKLVDLEYSSYGYRSFDLGTFLIEWNRELLDFQDIGLPSDADLENFIKLYIEACDKILPGYSQKPENSVKKILNETKLFILAQFMFFMTFMLKQNESFIDAIPFDRKSNLRFVDINYKKYLEIKEKFIKEGVIQSN